MKPCHVFHVAPSLPEKLNTLMELAYNIRWSWDHDTVDLFRRLDRDLWDNMYGNPVKMLGHIKQNRLKEVENDDAIMAHLERAYESLVEYLGEPKTWYQTYQKPKYPLEVAYFSMEFGLTECITNYSGGLGLLSGDHIKAASDLGIPFTGIGLLYQEGYFAQYLNADGWQNEKYLDNDFFTMPIRQLTDKDGKPVRIQVEYPTGTVTAQVWNIQVGRNMLLLLDTNLPEANSPEDCKITGALYGGDIHQRMKQEILLGIGGVRTLVAAGIEPNVYHMNEGHSAFLSMERIARYMRIKNLDFWESRSVVRASNVFTTHTPVPAGIDIFSPDIVVKYLKRYIDALGISEDAFLGLGRQNPSDKAESFSMAVFAIKNAALINGVSELHGDVSRKMFAGIWPDVPVDEVPITHVTNGVHTLSWVSKEMTDLLDRYLGPKWKTDPTDKELWKRTDVIPPEELWRTHERRRERLVAFARRKLAQQLESQGALSSEVRKAAEVLNPEALTIGFARRFATYKRGDLLMRDPERLIKLLNDKDRPVQIIYAGKAHPRDVEGKEVIKHIIHQARRPELRSHIVFLENYDIFLARYMTQGVDIWLNTPRRPMEASGTSGMKATVNGALNISVLDGWWCEGYNADLGWAIGHGEVYDNYQYQDEIEANQLYEILEKEVVPLYYERGSDGLPRRWIQMMKNSMKNNCPVFNTNRMVQQYAVETYDPCARRHDMLTENDCAETRAFTQWKIKVRSVWKNLKIRSVKCNGGDMVKVGDKMEIEAQVELAGLTPEDVLVQSVHGPLNADGLIDKPSIVTLQPAGTTGDGATVFKGDITAVNSGRHGHTLRVIPTNKSLQDPFKMGLILWA
ncbi:MAG TPA: alpha-glucan family phosphorylase [bacterium]|nr:alpha-glucan family phosphorylase [bacterium]